MEFIDPRSTPFIEPSHRGQLPHLYKPGGCYFVTFRLADAILPSRPTPRADSSKLRSLTPEAIAGNYEPRLTLGSCALRNPVIGKLVQGALLFFEGQRYQLSAWCVMPNHVHVIVAPVPPYSLSQILQSWKGFTARHANQLLGRAGPFWGTESFDHLIRSEESYHQFVEYVHMNPVRAGLCASPEDWPFDSARYEASKAR